MFVPYIRCIDIIKYEVREISIIIERNKKCDIFIY